MIRAEFFREQFAVVLERKSARNLQGRPKFVFGARRDRVGRAQDDVAGERIALGHVIESRVDFLRRDFPGDQRAVGEIRGEERLPDPADGSRSQHRRDPRHHGLDGHTGAARDFLERFAHEALDLVLGDGEDLRVDRIVVFNGKHRSIETRPGGPWL